MVNKQLELSFILLIFIFILFDHYLINGTEKIFFSCYLDNNITQRPDNSCKHNSTVSCLGFPSGHTELITLLTILLYYCKFISFNIAFYVILLTLLQRIISVKHTILQSVIGCVFGLIYALIYIKSNLSYKGFIITFIIFSALLFSIVYKIDKYLELPIPNWINNDMIQNINNKQNNTPLYLKILTIISNSILQDKTYMNWDELKINLDKLLEHIKTSGIKFDIIIGNTIEDIISINYLSKKLNIKMLKYDINENDIEQNTNISIKDKNIILFNNEVTDGKIMNITIHNLKTTYNANVVYPICISFLKNKFKYDYSIFYVLDYITYVWPWGYDNKVNFYTNLFHLVEHYY